MIISPTDRPLPLGVFPASLGDVAREVKSTPANHYFGIIDKQELPPLLEAARKEGLTILWVLVQPCLYEDTVINDYQAVYDPKTPLSTLESGQQEVVLAEIARIIKRTRLANTSEQNSPVQSTATFFAEQVLPPHVESKSPPEQVPSPRLDSRPPIEPACPTLPAIHSRWTFPDGISGE